MAGLVKIIINIPWFTLSSAFAAGAELLYILAKQTVTSNLNYSVNDKGTYEIRQ